jgi:hypothetical protein
MLRVIILSIIMLSFVMLNVGLLIDIMVDIIMLSFVMLNVANSGSHYSECCYALHRYAENR